MPESPPLSASALADLLTEARTRTLELVADLTGEQMMGPLLSIVNPPLWEIGHVAWFQEKWVLRHWGKKPPLRQDGDSLYDSAAVAHSTRWHLPLPSRQLTLEYMQRVLESALDRAKAHPPNGEATYFYLLAIFHEYMHAEAIAYTRQTHGYPAPHLALSARAVFTRGDGGALPGDVEVPGGSYQLGATRDLPFVFDNEKWAHPVKVEPFAIACAPVTNSEFAAFVEDGGYSRQELWSRAGWDWRSEAGARHPVYWRSDSGRGWLRRHFDQFVPLEPHLPVVHVNWYEAEAYCRWARRRLPSEAEWEMAASAEPSSGRRGISERKRRFPWGDEPPSPERANLDWGSMGLIPVDALPAGDSAFGCRQMIGNVWEWTATEFGPYPGFTVDPYQEYSQPWFYDHKVLRGGCWTTRSGLIRNSWRNFYQPHRRDVWAGFRTCASPD